MSPTHSRWCSLPAPVTFRVGVGPAEHHGRGAGAEGQRGELREHLLGVGVPGLQPPDGGVMDGPGVFAVDHQRVVDLAAFQHGSSQLHAVDESQAGIGDVEVLARAGQAQGVVHLHRRRRFQVRPADGGVDHQPDLTGVHTGLGHRLGSGHRGALGEGRPGVPPAALLDAGEPLHHSPAQTNPLVDRRQAVVHLVGGDDVRSIDGADRQHRGVAEPVDGIPAHVDPSYGADK
jgi:hypothetical protein